MRRRPDRRPSLDPLPVPPVIISDCLTLDPVEGAQMLAQRLVREAGEGATVICAPSTSADEDWHPVLTGSLVPRAALELVRLLGPTEVWWLPAGGLSFAVLMRLVLLHLVVPQARVRLVLLQCHRRPRRWMARLVGSFVTVVAGNAADRRRFGAVGLATELLAPETPEDRVSTLTRSQARSLLGLPQDARVHLHVGHATAGRNLRALGPLADQDLLVLVISPRFPLDQAVLPGGPGVVLVSERVEVGHYYRAADTLVFPVVDPNAVISMPMSIVEALGNQLPVVARRSAMTERWERDARVVLVDTDRELVAAALAVARRVVS